jgi:hypothetical protein
MGPGGNPELQPNDLSLEPLSSWREGVRSMVVVQAKVLDLAVWSEGQDSTPSFFLL